VETQHIALAISAANFILTWGVALYMYLANKDKATNGRISELQEDIDAWKDDHSERIAALEATARGAPNHSHLGGLHEKINGVKTDVSGIAGRLDGIDTSLRQLTNIIMQKGLK
jgi:hypothetical protein